MVRWPGLSRPGLLDEEQRVVAVMKLEGFANAEIAERLGIVEHSVSRKLAPIRLEWNEHAADSGGTP